MSDTNLYSYVGPDDNGKTINEQLLWPGYCEAAAMLPWQDTLKFTSGLSNFRYKAAGVRGGTEDCVDVNNRCTDLDIVAGEFYSGGKYVATIKGGSTYIYLAGEIVKGGSEVDVDLGGFSDQSKDLTDNISLNLTKQDGSAVRVRVLKATKPFEHVGSGPYVYLFPHPDAWYHGIVVWFFFKFRNWFWKK